MIEECTLQVDNASISAAIKDVFNETRTILEPAGAVAVAGVKAYLKARPEIKVGTPHNKLDSHFTWFCQLTNNF